VGATVARPPSPSLRPSGREPAGSDGAEDRRTETQLALLDAFELECRGEPVSLPLPAQRLLAFLALQPRPLQRVYVAGALWLDSTEPRASGSLRSALWRLRQTGHELVEATNHHLRLSPAVAVDVRRVVAWAAGVLDSSRELRDSDVANASFSGDLLPDWYDDWVLLERERLRQLRAHALETLCGRLAAAGRFGEAMEVGLAAVKQEPLRESAHRAVIGVHLAEGNGADALRHYRYYRGLLRDELRLVPSARMEELVRDLAGE